MNWFGADLYSQHSREIDLGNTRKRKGLWLEIVNGHFCTMTPGGMLLGGSPKLVGGKDATHYLPETRPSTQRNLFVMIKLWPQKKSVRSESFPTFEKVKVLHFKRHNG